MPHVSTIFFHSFCYIVASYLLISEQSTDFAMDPGVGWHIATGNWILENREIPHFDPFLSLPTGAQPRPWICDQWLSDLLLAVWVKNFGWSGVYLFITSIFITTFFVILYRILRTSAYAALGSTFAVLLAFKLSQIHYILRPVVFSFLFFTLAWSSARRVFLGETPKPYYYFFLPSLFVVWANMHPAFILGLCWIGLGCLCKFIIDCAEPPSTFGSKLKSNLPNVALCGLCMVATLCNPYGWTLHESIVSLGASDFFMHLHMEWLSPDFKSTEGSFLLLLLGLIVAGLYCSTATEYRYTLFDFCGALVATWLTLRSIRTLPFLGIVSTPLVVSALASLGHALATYCSRVGFTNSVVVINGAWDRLEKAEARYSQLWIPIIGAVLFLVASISKSSSFLDNHALSPAASYPAAKIIADLKEDLTEHSSSTTMVALPELGGAISLYGYPQIRALIDDRNTLLGEAHYKEFFAAINDRELLRDLMRKYKAQYILIDPKHPLAQLLQLWGDFERVRGEETGVLFRAVN